METIEKRIEKLLVDTPETASLLNQQVQKFKGAGYTKDEIEGFIFEEDALEQAGEVEEDTLMWSEIRDLQHDIAEEYKIDQEIDFSEDSLHIVKTSEVQNFKDFHEINNRTYLIANDMPESDYIYGDWDYTDYSEDEIRTIQSKLKDGETAIIVMSDKNFEAFTAKYF